ncbi:MAG: N-acetyl-gamma-glutamyl-phosphate reductase [Chloroflexi bacterium]|nr:N-acetyl-gamma-glutamyl-phosphate reductase [Chloroflexota bacterium]
MIKIGIFGATGYTGLELLKILQRHPAAHVAWLTSESSAGQAFGDVFTVSPAIGRLPLIASAEADLGSVDLVFCCLPHAVSLEWVAKARAAGPRVIDLSADYRLKDPAVYEKWYGHAHTQRELLAQAVYGLPELHRAAIKTADLVANPGCYPTSVILGLAPLAKAGWLRGVIIADSKSGISGAGRSLSLKTHFVEANENLSPYSIGRSHRHLPEMEQEIGNLVMGRLVDWGAGNLGVGPSHQPTNLPTYQSTNPPTYQLIFSPHLTPISRGMLSTIYVTLPEDVSEAQAREQYAQMYAGEPLVYLLKPGQAATMGHTTNTNCCAIGLTFVPATRTLIVTSSMDNLGKGASGQAVQNMNLMFGLAETTGLM